MSGVTASFLCGGFLPELVLDISNTVSPNIPALLAAAGWRGLRQPVRLLNTALVNTLVIPSNLAGARVTIENQSGACIGGVKNSGTALRLQSFVTIENLGTIAAGGGLGGGGGYVRGYYNSPGGGPASLYSGGGVRGEGKGFASHASIAISEATLGQAGGVNQSGSFPHLWVQGGKSGNGGDWGASGTVGAFGSASVGFSSVNKSDPTDGVLPGYCVDGNDYATWVAEGTRLGRIR